MSFKVSSVATNPDLPVVTPVITQINALATLELALRVGPGSQTLSGTDITALIDSKGTFTATQAVTSRQADYTLDAINGLAAAQFDGVDDVFLLSPVPNLASAFTFVVVAKPDPTMSAVERIAGNRTGAGQESYAFFSPGIAGIGHGSSSATAPSLDDDWNLIIGAWDGVDTILTQVNGGALASNASDGSFSTNGFTLGAGNAQNLGSFGGQLKLFHMHDANLFATDAGLASIALYRDLCRNAYGMPVA